MTYSQLESRREIMEHISIRELLKKDLRNRLEKCDSKVQKQYLREKIRDINTDLRFFHKIYNAFTRTIQSKK